MNTSADSGPQYTIVGRYTDTGDITLHHISVPHGDIHFEVLKHWGHVPNAERYEVLVVLPGAHMPAATPATVKTYVQKHYGRMTAAPAGG